MRKIIGILLGVCAILAMYLGAYEPWKKSRAYVGMLRTNIRTVQELESAMGRALDMQSPVGQEEVVKYSIGFIGEQILNQDLTPDIARELVEFVEQYAFSNNVQHLIVMGEMHHVLWKKYGIEDSYGTAESYLVKARTMGPKLPPVLYALLRLYRDRGDLEKLNEVASTIQSFWPDENFAN